VKRILFVDDEANILAGLRRTLRPIRKDWAMEFVTGGEEALAMMSERPFQVVVSDMRMPGMNGVQLLREVKNRYPATLRLILSGFAETEMTVESAAVAHQFLAKPCDAETLRSAVERVTALSEMLTDQRLVTVVSQFDSLPSLPSLYIDIMNELSSPTGSLMNVGKIVSKDVAMTAKILQLVNSAFFGIPRHVSSPSQAVNLLGMDIIRSLVLSSKVFSSFDQKQIKGVNLDSLWQHSLATGALAKRIAVLEGLDRKLQDKALFGGMLHDIGKLVLADGSPDELEKATALAFAEHLRIWEAEQRTLGCSHAEIGGYLVGLWGLPSVIVESIAYHHRPNAAPGDRFTCLTAVHAANALLHEQDDGEDETQTPLLDHDYLQRLGLDNHVSIWREAQQELSEK
jgi:putative nucleotidyltransferase with HDIG domain